SSPRSARIVARPQYAHLDLDLADAAAVALTADLQSSPTRNSLPHRGRARGVASHGEHVEPRAPMARHPRFHVRFIPPAPPGSTQIVNEVPAQQTGKQHTIDLLAVNDDHVERGTDAQRPAGTGT